MNQMTLEKLIKRFVVFVTKLERCFIIVVIYNHTSSLMTSVKNLCQKPAMKQALDLMDQMTLGKSIEKFNIIYYKNS